MLRDWWVHTVDDADHVILLKDHSSGDHGRVVDPTPAEWQRATQTPMTPYRWSDAARVKITPLTRP